MPMPIDQLRAEDFSSLRDQSLSLCCGDTQITCHIDSVRLLPPHALRSQPPFAVVLRGPRSPSLPQGMASLRHPAHGVLEVFVVPIGPCGDGVGYELTFN